MKKKFGNISNFICAILAVTIVFISNITSCAATVVTDSCAYYTVLSADEQIVYNELYTKIYEHNDDLFALSKTLTEQELEDVMNALFNDHPELYWAQTGYQYAVDSAGVVHKVKLKYCINLNELDSSKQYFEELLNNLISGAMVSSTKLEQEKYLHDTICQLLTYDASNALCQGTYESLTTKKAMCAGYARLFQIACRKLDIPCYYLTGTSNGESHAWNMVIIDGKQYFVDLTWDDTDSSKNVSYKYFNKSFEDFAKDHAISELSQKII